MNIQEQADGSTRYLAAGVDRIEIKATTISGDRAAVNAQADVWAELGQTQAGGKLAIAHPRNTVLYSMNLEKIDGQWMVVEESMTFAPGSEP